jgi:hypothetical protein
MWIAARSTAEHGRLARTTVAIAAAASRQARSLEAAGRCRVAALEARRSPPGGRLEAEQYVDGMIHLEARTWGRSGPPELKRRRGSVTVLMAATDGAIMAGPIGAITPIVDGDESWPSECGVRATEMVLLQSHSRRHSREFLSTSN